MGKTNETGAVRRCPPLPADRARIADYQMTGKPAGHDGEPPVHGERRDFIYMDGKREPTLSPENVNHSRILYLYRRGRIEQRQFDAAERLAKDWELSQIQPRASSVLVGAGGGGPGDLPNDAKCAAMRRHGNARAALGRAWPVIELVVEMNVSVEKAAAMIGVHTKYGHGMLNVALHFLADHYKMA